MITKTAIKGAICFLLILFCFYSDLNAEGLRISSVEFKVFGLVNDMRCEHLVLSHKLCQLAEQVAEDKFRKEFEISESTESGCDLTPDEVGYFAEMYGMTSTVIVFSNYLDTDTAAGLIFESMLEQQDGNDLNQGILAPGMAEAGIKIIEAPISFGRTQFNVYLGVIVWAAPEYGVSEVDLLSSQVVNLVNQRRNALDRRAMIPDPEISAYDCHEIVLELGEYDVENSAAQLFQGLIEKNDLFKAEYNVIDIAIDIYPELSNGTYQIETIGKIKFAVRNEDSISITGLVYKDKDMNGQYDAGEGVSFAPMVIYDAGIHSRTGSAGGFFENVSDSDKGYQIVVFPDGHEVIIRSVNPATNHFCLIKIDDET